MSHSAAPLPSPFRGRLTARWSVAGGGQPSCTASTAGPPCTSEIVLVSPPLSLRPCGSSPALVFVRSVAPKPVVPLGSLMRFSHR